MLIATDGHLYPIEIKKTATPQAEAIRTFAALGRFRETRGPEGLVCLYLSLLPLDAQHTAVPLALV